MSLLALAVALAGCGQSDEQQVRDVAQRFEDAMSDNDVRGACRAMSRGSRDAAALPGARGTSLGVWKIGDDF